MYIIILEIMTLSVRIAFRITYSLRPYIVVRFSRQSKSRPSLGQATKAEQDGGRRNISCVLSLAPLAMMMSRFFRSGVFSIVKQVYLLDNQVSTCQRCNFTICTRAVTRSLSSFRGELHAATVRMRVCSLLV